MKGYEWNEVIREMKEEGLFKSERKEVTITESLSVNELIDFLQLVKAQVGGDVKVYSFDCGYEKDISSVRIGYYSGDCVILE